MHIDDPPFVPDAGGNCPLACLTEIGLALDPNRKYFAGFQGSLAPLKNIVELKSEFARGLDSLRTELCEMLGDLLRPDM